MNLELINSVVDIITRLLFIGIPAYLIVAFKGRNGWAKDEIAQLTLLGLLVYVFMKEANRAHEWNIFSEWVVLMLLVTVLSIAKLDNVMSTFGQLKNKIKEGVTNEKNNSNNADSNTNDIVNSNSNKEQ